VSSQTNKDSVLQPCQTFEKCSQGKFLSVSELSTAVDKSCGSGAIDLVYKDLFDPFSTIYLHFRFSLSGYYQ